VSMTRVPDSVPPSSKVTPDSVQSRRVLAEAGAAAQTITDTTRASAPSTAGRMRVTPPCWLNATPRAAVHGNRRSQRWVTRSARRPGHQRPDGDLRDRRVRAGTSSTCRIVAATVSGRIHNDEVVRLALLLVHLLLHRGRRARREDRRHPHAVAISSARSASARARRPNFDAAYAAHEAPADSPAAEFTKTTIPCAARRAGRQARVSRAGETRLTSSCSRKVAGGELRDRCQLDDPGDVQQGVEPLGQAV